MRDDSRRELTKTRRSVTGGVPLNQKYLLTLEEAAAYTGLGLQKLRNLSNGEDCQFVLWNGSKRMFKREKLEKYLGNAYSL